MKKLTDQVRPIGRTGFVATPVIGKPPVSETQREHRTPPKKVTRKEAAKLRSKRWDGADDAAFDIVQTAMSGLTLGQKRKVIAARLRKIAQGPRKWGVLR